MTQTTPVILAAAASLTIGAVGCGSRASSGGDIAPDRAAAAEASAFGESSADSAAQPILPPRLAMLAGLLPLRSTGVDVLRSTHPDFDGRGVVIGILDSGIDVGVPGLRQTSTGLPKVLDLRDFSGEGRVRLSRLKRPAGDRIEFAGKVLTGFGRFASLAAPPYYAGVFRELVLGKPPAADVNGNGTNTDELLIAVGKGGSGWFLMTDTDSDGTLVDERPVYDYAVAGETLTFSVPGGTSPGPLTIAANISEVDGEPVLNLFFDTSGHGTHVAGIAAGHDLFGVSGFDGVAPGAQVLALKISNNARGGISVTGSMLRAMNYAADYAHRRGLPLVLNVSFGIGNEIEGAATIDSLVDEFVLRRPDVLLVVSAGNDGPGLSTVGFPGSAELAIAACALLPGVFAKPPEPGVPPTPDVLGWWSARGGEVSKPDLCAPGVAFSNVPRWHTGEEISGGTSMSAPQISGAAAVLQSAMLGHGRLARAIDLKRALKVTARTVSGATRVDAGEGIPDLPAAYRWLLASHQTGVYVVRSLKDGGNSSHGPAAYRRNGLITPSDTLQRFLVRSVGGQPAAALLLKSDATWLRAPEGIEMDGGPATVEVTYDGDQLTEPGLHVGTAWAWPASDTLGGVAFGLTNTIVVPYSLDRPLAARRTLRPGRLARYFLRVPKGAGGLSVSLRLSYPEQEVTLYLFEPNGQPYRGGSSVEAGGAEPPQVMIQVAAHDLIPGVYEAVVVAAPATPVTYFFEAALPPVIVAPIDSIATALVQNIDNAAIRAEVTSRLIGVQRWARVEGTRSETELIRAKVPSWATMMVVDVRLPLDVWHALTDFGVTVFDSAGQLLSEGPLDYSFGRQTLDVEESSRGGYVDVELFPAFAHLQPPSRWSADVEISFLADSARELTLENSTLDTSAALSPGAAWSVSIAPVPDTFEVPELFAPLVEITARPETGPASVRRGRLPSVDPTRTPTDSSANR